MHEYFMSLAINEAKKAYEIGEVPVGAVIVKDNIVVASAYNMKETLRDTTAHAEILAIKKASEKLGGWRLLDCSIYVTLEPCIMCAGAIVASRIDNVVFGAFDKRFGACRTLYNVIEDNRLNHNAKVIPGVLENECSGILSDFFKSRRQNRLK